MQKNQRKSSNAMDGFVPRNRVNASRRGSVESSPKRDRRATDGFIPRSAVSTKPLTMSDDKWSDENTLTISETTDLDHPSGISEKKGTLTGGVGKPKWWQFGKKRRIRKGKPEPSRRKKIVKRTIFFLLLLLVLIGGYLGWKVLKNTGKVFNGNILGFLDSTKLDGEESGRVNILLAGTSEDDVDHDGADLTDSIMLISLDTKNNTAFTVSIPRDLWVKYGERCSSGYEGKINVAYQCGEDVQFKENGYAEGGMGLLQKIVSSNLDIPIQYYGKINYTAFRQAVDAVGGIDVNIQSSDPRGIYDPNIQPKDGGPVRLKNGIQHLDGKLALALARSRNVRGGYGMSRGDFDRTTYQRAMLIALKDKALSTGVITNPAKLGSLLDAAGDNVDTNFESGEVRRLYELSKLIKNQNIKSIDLTTPDIALLTTGMYGGQSIVRPVAGISNFNPIKLYFKKIMSTDPIVREGATVVVLNGSGVSGFAQKKADELTTKGIAVNRVGNTTTREATVIVDMTGGKKNSTKSYLEKLYKVTATSTVPTEAKGYQTDFVILIGKATTTPATTTQ